MLMDIMDDFVFGPMNLIGRIVRLVAGALRTSKARNKYKQAANDTTVIALRRIDKKGEVDPLTLIRHMTRNGVDIIGGTNGVTHDSQNIYITLATRQLPWFNWLYNGGELRSPKRSWKSENSASKKRLKSPRRAHGVRNDQ